jgi:hypothetical protein
MTSVTEKLVRAEIAVIGRFSTSSRAMAEGGSGAPAA